MNSNRLKFASLVPVPIGLAIGVPLLLPKPVGALTQTLLMSTKPVVVSLAFRAAFLFPKLISLLSNNLVEPQIGRAHV